MLSGVCSTHAASAVASSVPVSDYPFTTVTVGQVARSPAPLTGDFNEDGRSDLLADGFRAGRGDGTFRPPRPAQSSDPGCDACPDTVTDLDGDGHLDVLHGGFRAKAPSISFGDGTGRLSNARELPSFDAVGEFDGDSRLDLATIELDTTDPHDLGVAAVLVRPGAPGRRFASPVRRNVTGPATDCSRDDVRKCQLSDVAVGDIDADGYEDMVLTQRNYLDDAPTQTLINGGGEGFTLEDSGVMRSGNLKARLTDIDLDGRADLLRWGVGLQACLCTLVSLSNGDGTFRDITEQDELGTWLGDPIAADFDGDGLTDLATGRYVTSNYSAGPGLALGTGQGFGGQVDDPASRPPSSLDELTQGAASADYNGDGHPDLALVRMARSDSRSHLIVQLYGTEPISVPLHVQIAAIRRPGSLRGMVRRGVRLTALCSGRCLLRASIRISANLARRIGLNSRRISRADGTGPAGGERKLKLKVSERTARRIRASGVRRVRYDIRLSARKPGSAARKPGSAAQDSSGDAQPSGGLLRLSK